MTGAWSMPSERGFGPGSRGGQWHDPEFQARYHREWRAAHPEYRERERERARARRLRGEVRHVAPANVIPVLTAPCACPDCRCRNTVPVVACGMCLSGLHEEQT